MKSSRILILNSSPKAGGTISRILCEMKHGAEGCEVDYVDVTKADIGYCKGCMSCRSGLECAVYQDDAQKILEKMRWCDVLIIGAPCYWQNMPAPLKALFDRIVYGLVTVTKTGLKPLLKGKKCVIVTACTTPSPFHWLLNQSRATVTAIKRIVKPAGFDVVKTIEVAGTANKHLTESELRKYRDVIGKL